MGSISYCTSAPAGLKGASLLAAVTEISLCQRVRLPLSPSMASRPPAAPGLRSTASGQFLLGVVNLSKRPPLQRRVWSHAALSEALKMHDIGWST